GGLLGPGGDEVVPGEGFGADEPPLEVAVDLAGGLRRARALADGPGADLLLARGEEADQVEEPVAGADQAPEAWLREAELLEEHLAFLGRELHQLGLDPDRERDYLGRLPRGGDRGAERGHVLVLPARQVRFGDVGDVQLPLGGEELERR